MNIIFLSTIFILIGISVAEKKIICYHGTWSTYRFSYGKFGVENINPFLCTHLMYAFFGIKENGELRVIDPYLDLEDDWGRGNIKKFNNLKKINPKLKTLAAIGGWNEGSKKFSEVAKDPIKRARFINSSIVFTLKHGFDGIDLDWEYPAQREGDANSDKKNYVLLVSELSKEAHKNKLLLTAAVASVEFSAKLSYNIAEVSKYLDFINVMAYDLHGSWDDVIGINAPLYAGSADVTEKEKQLNVNASISYWLKQGAPSEKLIIGLPAYGRTFTLLNQSETQIGARNNGPGLAGRYTNEPGMIGYNELCEKFTTEEWTINWEDQQKVPYAFKGNQWIGYDNIKSVGLKTQYALDRNLGGIMIWSVETDDFYGICGESYPLLKEINRIFGRNITDVPQPTSTTSSSTSSTSSTGSTHQPQPPSATECTAEGIFQNKENCAAFYVCSSGIRYDFHCPGNLLFDENLKSCNYSNLVNC